jgi:hypothetical protein
VTETDHTTFSPESYSPMVAPAVSGPTRSWDRGAAAAGGEDSANAALSQEKEKEKEKDVLHGDNTVTPDVSSRSPLTLPTVDAVVAGSSLSLDAAHMGRYPSRPHGQYDIA